MFGFGKRDSGFKLSRRSRRRLKGVHPDLVRVVESAIKITEVDFAVLEGMRSRERQRKLVDSGASQTMNSRHLTGHAVDLGAWVDGELRWDWPLYHKIASAMQRAAEEEGVAVEWGGCWCKINGGDDPEAMMDAYAERKRTSGDKPFMDGPHYQLPWGMYPAD